MMAALHTGPAICLTYAQPYHIKMSLLDMVLSSCLPGAEHVLETLSVLAPAKHHDCANQYTLETFSAWARLCRGMDPWPLGDVYPPLRAQLDAGMLSPRRAGP